MVVCLGCGYFECGDASPLLLLPLMRGALQGERNKSERRSIAALEIATAQAEAEPSESGEASPHSKRARIDQSQTRSNQGTPRGLSCVRRHAVARKGRPS